MIQITIFATSVLRLWFLKAMVSEVNKWLLTKCQNEWCIISTRVNGVKVFQSRRETGCSSGHGLVDTKADELLTFAKCQNEWCIISTRVNGIRVFQSRRETRRAFLRAWSSKANEILTKYQNEGWLHQVKKIVQIISVTQKDSITGRYSFKLLSKNPPYCKCNCKQF